MYNSDSQINPVLLTQTLWFLTNCEHMLYCTASKKFEPQRQTDARPRLRTNKKGLSFVSKDFQGLSWLRYNDIVVVSQVPEVNVY